MINQRVYKLVVDRVERHVRAANLERDLFVGSEFEIEFYDNRIDKQAVLLIHGLGVEGKFQWYNQLQVLSSNFRVVMPNLMSFGQSRSMTNSYTISDQIEAMNSLIRELELEKPIIMGISYGGLIAAEMARLSAVDLNKLLLMDAPVKFFDRSDIERVSSALKVSSIENLFVPDQSSGLKALFLAATGQNIPIWQGVMDKFYEEMFLSKFHEKRMMIGEMLKAIDDYRENEYSGISVPVKLIWGQKDLLVPYDRAKLLQQHIGKNAELSIVKGAGHIPNFQRSTRFNQLMMDFLTKP